MIWSIKMTKKIILLGDSIIDNKSYVSSNELDVTEHLEKLFYDESNIAIENHAVDGDTMYQLERDHLDSNLLSGATHIVVSIGGNDLLHTFRSYKQQVSCQKLWGKEQ